MRVLLLSPGTYAEGGAERSATILVGGLIARGHEVTVLGLEGSATRAYAQAGARTRLLPETTGSGTAVRHGSSARILLGALEALPGVADVASTITQEIRSWRPDVIYSNGARMHLVSATLPSRVPVAWALRDVPPKPIHRRLLKQASRRCSLILANSRFTAAYLEPTSVPVEVVGNPIASITASDRGESRQRLGIRDGRPAVAMVAHLHASKGHHIAIEALAAFDPESRPHLLIAGGNNYPGSAEYQAALVARIAELGLTGDITFLGAVGELNDLYGAADVLVHPAIHPEGFGRTVVEAQAAGVPVVATDIGGIKELCEESASAVLVPPDDPDAVAAALGRVLHDDDARAQLVASGLQNASQFTPEHHVDQVESLLTGLANE
ncbi:MAG: glycosyltransferase family 4 protein [Candidatus Nanopelagicales bacterium]